MWGKSAGCFFALLLPLGYGFVVTTWFALTPAHNALRCVLLALVVLLPLLSLSANLVELRLRCKVLIRTGLGTVAVLVAFVILVVNFRNYLGVVIGTWHILADLYWLVCDDI